MVQKRFCLSFVENLEKSARQHDRRKLTWYTLVKYAKTSKKTVTALQETRVSLCLAKVLSSRRFSNDR